MPNNPSIQQSSFIANWDYHVPGVQVTYRNGEDGIFEDGPNPNDQEEGEIDTRLIMAHLKCSYCGWYHNAILDSVSPINLEERDLQVQYLCPHCHRNEMNRVLSISYGRETIYSNAIYCERCRVEGISTQLFRSERRRHAERLCEPCFENAMFENLIYNHSWVPNRFSFIKGKKESSKRTDGQDLIYYGMELEINTPPDVYNHALKFKEWLVRENLGEYFYFKKDGSISQGYEIVSMPFTTQARHELLDWRRILDYLKLSGATSEESGECGLHIHASRRPLRQREIGALKYFFWNNRHIIHKLSRRTNYRYCELEEYRIKYRKWAGRNHLLESFPDSGSRYVAVNSQTGKNTIEFRVMRGTLDYKRFLASFQFIDALIHFVKSHSIMTNDTPYTWSTFRRWLRNINNYGHLERYLDKEGLK